MSVEKGPFSFYFDTNIKPKVHCCAIVGEVRPPSGYSDRGHAVWLQRDEPHGQGLFSEAKFFKDLVCIYKDIKRTGKTIWLLGI